MTFAPDDPESCARARLDMVESQLVSRGIRDADVLRAMGQVPREAFVPEPDRALAYADGPLALGHGQTISQPYVVAWMMELAGICPGSTALDVGTGSGYQAAAMAEVGAHVYGLERLPILAETTQRRLEQLGYGNITLRLGDAFEGWSGPLNDGREPQFDAIVVAAAPEIVPPKLVEQLAPGGRLVLPVGTRQQELVVVRKSNAGAVEYDAVGAVRFVPLVPGPP